jgi:hypothetical protein
MLNQNWGYKMPTGNIFSLFPQSLTNNNTPNLIGAPTSGQIGSSFSPQTGIPGLSSSLGLSGSNDQGSSIGIGQQATLDSILRYLPLTGGMNSSSIRTGK